jgi:hypothetical protein
MSIEEFAVVKKFAAQRRVKVRRDSCDEAIIPGKPRKMKRAEDRSHIFEDGDKLGLCLLLTSVRAYNHAQHRLLAAGFTQSQDGDTEGTFLFDADDAAQAKVAIREAGIVYRRVVTDEQRARLVATLAGNASGRLGTTNASPVQGSATAQPRLLQ